MTGASADFLDRLDAAIGCQQCGGPLGESPSDDFCSPEHQNAWMARHTEPLPWSDDAARVYVGRDDAQVPLTEPGQTPPSLGRSDDLIAEFDRIARARAVPRITVDVSAAEAALRGVGQAFDQTMGTFARAFYLNSIHHHIVTSNPGTHRGRRIEGQRVTWSEMDETQRLWTTENCGTVLRYEVDHAEPREPTPGERAIEARRNRNTGPPATRMDGRRRRGGPRR